MERACARYHILPISANVTMYNFNNSKCLRDLTCRSRDTLEHDRNLRGMEGMIDEMSRGQENSRMF